MHISGEMVSVRMRVIEVSIITCVTMRPSVGCHLQVPAHRQCPTGHTISRVKVARTSLAVSHP